MKESRKRGQAVIEAALVVPWIFFLFIGTLNVGLLLYALISVQNAARVAAEYTSSNATLAANSAGACQAALPELNQLPGASNLSTCAALPVIVTATSVTGPDGAPATNVSVTYQAVPLMAMPGLTAGQWTITRTVQMRVP